MTWGDEEQVRARFAVAGIRPDRITFERPTWFFRHNGSPAALLSIFRNYYGPTMNAFEAASKSGREDDLSAELELLFEAQNTGGESAVIPATFLKVIVTKE
jgi:hypothetical protein